MRNDAHFSLLWKPSKYIYIYTTQLQWNLYAKKKIIFFIQILLIYSLMWFSMHFPSWRREARDTAQNNADDMKNIEFECHMRRGGKHSRIVGAASKCWVCVCVCVFSSPHLNRLPWASEREIMISTSESVTTHSISKCEHKTSISRSVFFSREENVFAKWNK